MEKKEKPLIEELRALLSLKRFGKGKNNDLIFDLIERKIERDLVNVVAVHRGLITWKDYFKQRDEIFGEFK